MKKYIMNTIFIVTILPVICIAVFIIQNTLLTKSFESNYISSTESYIVYTKLQRCNFNIIQPKLARITEFEDRNEKRISFYNPSHLFHQNKEEWKQSRTGGTTIRNTTFPELVKMVKEDCSQFQQAKGDIRDETINWSYSKYVPEVPKTQEEIREEERSLEIFKKKIESGEITRTTLEGFVEIKE